MVSLLTLEDVKLKAGELGDSLLSETANILQSFEEKMNVLTKVTPKPAKKGRGRKSIRMPEETKEMSEIEKCDLFYEIEQNVESLIIKHRWEVDELRSQFLGAIRKQLFLSSPVKPLKSAISSSEESSGSRQSISDVPNSSHTSIEENSSPNLKLALEEEEEEPKPVSQPRKRTRKSFAVNDFEDMDFLQELPAKSAKRARKSCIPNISQTTKRSRKSVSSNGNGSLMNVTFAGFGSDAGILESEDESNDGMMVGQVTMWQPMSATGHVLPERPAVYELKVRQAKKSAFIGFCDNLKKRVSDHFDPKIKVQKQVDTFILRNQLTVDIAFHEVNSVDEAKQQQKSMLDEFRLLNKCAPAYNNF